MEWETRTGHPQKLDVGRKPPFRTCLLSRVAAQLASISVVREITTAVMLQASPTTLWGGACSRHLHR